jgi:polyhydroxybutyrate depolymerase
MNRLPSSLFAASTLLIAACGSGTTGPTASPTPAPASASASPAPAPPAPAPPAPPAPSTAAAPYPAGLSEQQITVDGVARQYRVHVPATLAGAPKAVVLVLHGGGGEGTNVADTGRHPLSVFRSVADREGFVVVYPGGLPARDIEGNPGWVDCRADNTVSSGADDLGFLAALAERVRAEFGLTRSRVFMAGSSNGAQMTHAFAFDRADLVAAVATSAGSLPQTPRPGGCTTGPSRPLPILILHGTADTQMPWGGGCVANLGGACNRGRVISAEATRNRWLAINGLTGTTSTATVINDDTSDGGPANRFDYAGPAPVQWWRLDGAGHAAPSRSVPVGANPVTGIQNRDVEFAELAWSFFAARLPDASSAAPPSASAIP